MMSLNVHIALSMITSASAFGSVPYSTDKKPSFLARPQQTKSSLPAVIYGWDGEEDEIVASADESVSYGLASKCVGAGASPDAVALAETLSYDRDHKGTLARLAVAFSPPERALTLDDIENVEVICVTEDSIEIEAILCEHHGCVSLAIPVSFPQACGSEWLEGCVMRNIDELNENADSLINVINSETVSSDADLDELCLLNGKIEYPSWWIPPECDANLVAECDTIKRLLNDGEFQENVKALARSSLIAQENGSGYDILKAAIADVGPAGICLKVRAAFRYEVNQPQYTLDVLVPFGGVPKQDAVSLRAAVLGAVMAAES